MAKSSSGMWAGCGGVVIGFPVLYAGVFYNIPWLTILGFIIFAVGILVEPALRFIPQRAAPEKPHSGKPPGPPENQARNHSAATAATADDRRGH